MEFWEHMTMFDRFVDLGEDRRERERRKSYGRELFYEEALRRAHQVPVSALNDHLPAIVADTEWYNSERPYFRVYPIYADIFSRTKLNIPLRELRMPYVSFTVRFAKEHEPEAAGFKIRTFMFSAYYNPAYQTNILTVAPQLFGQIDGENAPPAVLLPIASGPYEPDAEETAETLLHKIVAHYETRPTGCVSREVQRGGDWLGFTFRVGLSVAFLASGGDKIIEPDVLNTDFNAYLDLVNRRDRAEETRQRSVGEEAAEAIDELHRRATSRRRGVGYTVGRRETILGQRGTTHSRTGTEGKSWELTHQHQRGGHIHRFRVGPGRNDVIRKWIPQLTVRPDLPPDPRPKGSRTPAQ